jgi:hypothetical protein
MSTDLADAYFAAVRRTGLPRAGWGQVDVASSSLVFRSPVNYAELRPSPNLPQGGGSANSVGEAGVWFPVGIGNPRRVLRVAAGCRQPQIISRRETALA